MQRLFGQQIQRQFCSVFYHEKCLPTHKLEKNKTFSKRIQNAGPSFSGKKYFIMKKMENIVIRDIFVLSKSPEVFEDEFSTEEK